MQTLSHRSALRRAVGYAVGLGAVWAVAAALRPDTTYHLAPLLIAATLPFVLVSEQSTVAVRVAAAGAAGGVAVALIATIALGMADLLRGPSLLPFGGAVVEAVGFSVGGGAVGMVAALGRRRA